MLGIMMIWIDKFKSLPRTCSQISFPTTGLCLHVILQSCVAQKLAIFQDYPRSVSVAKINIVPQATILRSHSPLTIHSKPLQLSLSLVVSIF